jgi:hypothetical protein
MASSKIIGSFIFVQMLGIIVTTEDTEDTEDTENTEGTEDTESTEISEQCYNTCKAFFALQRLLFAFH